MKISTLYEEATRDQLYQHIAQQDATIAALRKHLTEMERNFSRISYAMAEPNEMECSDYDVHLNDEHITDMVIAELIMLREQLARMPVCVGYVSLSCLEKMKRAKNRDSYSLSKNLAEPYFYPIYIVPQEVKL